MHYSEKTFIRIVSIKKQDVINDEEVRAERMGFY